MIIGSAWNESPTAAIGFAAAEFFAGIGLVRLALERQGLRRHEEVVVDGHELLNGGSATVGIGGQDTQSEWNAADWKRLASSLEKALEAPPDKQIQVRVEVSRGR